MEDTVLASEEDTVLVSEEYTAEDTALASEEYMAEDMAEDMVEDTAQDTVEELFLWLSSGEPEEAMVGKLEDMAAGLVVAMAAHTANGGK